VDVSDSLDNQAGNPNTGTATGATAAQEIYIGATASYDNFAQSTPTNGFTLVDGVPFIVGGATVAEGVLEKIVSYPQTISSAVTCGTSHSCGAILALKPTTPTAYHYALSSKYEDGTNLAINATVLDTSGASSTINIPSGANVTYYFTDRPTYFTWNITASYYRRIYVTADTGSFVLTIPEATFAVFTPLIRDFAYATNSGAYLESYRSVGGANTLIERVPLTNLINGIPLILTINRVYTLLVNTPTVDFSFSFYSTTATASPVLVLTPPSYSDVLQFNTRYIHANLTRPTTTTIKLEYLDDLANTTITVFNIRTRAGALVATWNTTSDNFSHTHAGLTNTTDYIAEALITHGEYGNLTYRRVFAGAVAPITPPDLTGLGTFGAIDMTQVLGAGIIVISAAMFGAINVGGGLIVTALVAATLDYYGWITIDAGVIVLVIAVALFYIWGRARN
jgi:hypothetical protein